MNRKKLALFLSGLLLVSLSGCQAEEQTSEGDPKAEVILDIENDYGAEVLGTFQENCHVTSAFLLDEGTLRSIHDEEYQKLLATSEKYDVDKLSKGKITVQKVYLKYNKSSAIRMTALLNKAAFIDLGESISVERTAVKGESFLDKENLITSIDQIVREKYSAGKSAETYCGSNEAVSLTPSGKYNFSTLVFLPKFFTLEGVYEIDGNTKKWVCQYPCIDESGYAEGLFLLIESDSTDNLAEVGA